MNLKLITEKFKDILSPEDLEAVHSEVTKVIAEQVQTRLDVEKDELSILAEKYAEEKTKKALKKAKKKMEEAYNAKLEALEESVVNKLDRFLDNEISSKISDEALKAVAINETYSPIISDIMESFENRFVKLDSKGHKLVQDLRSQLDENSKQINSLISEKMELANLVEQTSIKSLIAEKSKALTESQSKKLVKLCEGKDFQEIHDKIETLVDIVSESSKKVLKESKQVVTNTVSDEELIQESVKVSTRDNDSYDNSILKNAMRLI